MLCAGYARSFVGDSSRAYQVSETASSLTEIWCGSKGKSDPRQITPKGSGRQLYPRKGSGERRAQRNWPRSSVALTRGNGNAGSENAGRPYREADMRRDARDEGATQPEVGYDDASGRMSGHNGAARRATAAACLRQRSEAQWPPAEDPCRQPHGARHRPKMGGGGRQHPQGCLAAQQERNGMRGAA